MTHALTSISPRHAIGDAQLHAVESWAACGLKVLSFNSPTEIDQLRERYPSVEFVPVHHTMEGVQKVPYVPISAFIEYAKRNALEQVMLINSDIAINDPNGLVENYCGRAKDGLIFANREDHNGDGNGKRYIHGFDVFIIHSDYYHLITASMFCMGQTWWDYWVPWQFITAKVPVTLVKEPLFFHRAHPVQYSGQEWVRMTEHFQWMTGQYKGQRPQQVNDQVFRMITRAAR
jgi:hypothetical protein